MSVTSRGSHCLLEPWGSQEAGRQSGMRVLLDKTHQRTRDRVPLGDWEACR